MKKLLWFFTAIGIITTSSTVVACGSPIDPLKGHYFVDRNKVLFNKYEFQLDEDCIYATLILGMPPGRVPPITAFNSYFKINNDKFIHYLKVNEELPVQDKYDNLVYHFTIVRNFDETEPLEKKLECTFSFELNNEFFTWNNLKTKITILPK
ncbi:lipoprotein [Spiroplasma chrysopicola]|uniref:Lipoprotein n=1 Tax=Spiroplasma chrysopicola DF-1 TaxID=1276227 RepID=R4UFJ9_9MOLU|nr:lipoprotein [Spiroplasma chrysopicola]AGM24935.1 hypothetical protein SCHRY_v1c03520 [Spiroplasma chrysopicola DF-1]